MSVMASGAGSPPSILDVFVNVLEPGVSRETQITKLDPKFVSYLYCAVQVLAMFYDRPSKCRPSCESN